MLEALTACWSEEVQPQLAEAGVTIVAHDDLKKKQKKALRRFFREQIFPR